MLDVGRVLLNFLKTLNMAGYFSSVAELRTRSPFHQLLSQL
jgi:hypothetical protein